jgi:hypothetical protein
MNDLAAQAGGYHAEAERLRKAGDLDAALIRQRRAVALGREAGDTIALAHAVRHIADMLVANALRSAAVHAEAIGDGDTAEGFWLKARQRYAALDDMFEKLTGQPGNPGVAEADRRINALRG